MGVCVFVRQLFDSILWSIWAFGSFWGLCKFALECEARFGRFRFRIRFVYCLVKLRVLPLVIVVLVVVVAAVA